MFIFCEHHDIGPYIYQMCFVLWFDLYNFNYIMYFLAPIVERLLPLPTRITPPPSPPEFLTQRVKLVAHRRGRDRQVSEPGENSSGDEEWRKRSKMPRMRMHADDEEEKRDRRMKRVHRNRWIIFILLRMAGSCNYEVYVWRHKPVCGSWQK